MINNIAIRFYNASSILWFGSFIISLLLHFGVMYAIWFSPAKTQTIEIGGFESTLGDTFQSVMLVSDLPLGEAKEFSQNSKKSRITPQTKKIKKKQSGAITNQESKDAVLHAAEKFDTNIANEDSQSQATDIAQNSPSQDKNIEQDSTQQDMVAQAQTLRNDNANSTVLQGIHARDIKSYQSLLMAHLTRFKTYPQDSINNKEEGVVAVRIRIDENGNVLSQNVKQGCKFAALNNAALMLLQKASPLPKPPSDMLRQGYLTFSLPIVYSLRER